LASISTCLVGSIELLDQLIDGQQILLRGQHNELAAAGIHEHLSLGVLRWA
jgi:hypothetical protein